MRSPVRTNGLAMALLAGCFAGVLACGNGGGGHSVGERGGTAGQTPDEPQSGRGAAEPAGTRGLQSAGGGDTAATGGALSELGGGTAGSATSASGVGGSDTGAAPGEGGWVPSTAGQPGSTGTAGQAVTNRGGVAGGSGELSLVAGGSGEGGGTGGLSGHGGNASAIAEGGSGGMTGGPEAGAASGGEGGGPGPLLGGSSGHPTTNPGGQAAGGNDGAGAPPASSGQAGRAPGDGGQAGGAGAGGSVATGGQGGEAGGALVGSSGSTHTGGASPTGGNGGYAAECLTFGMPSSDLGEGLLMEEGGTCSPWGAGACSSTDSRAALVCDRGEWAVRELCGLDQSCDRTRGTCDPILAECRGEPPIPGFCQGDVAAACGPDLIDLVTAPCCGRCVDGVCLPSACGDGKLVAGEICDDGNTAAADGCEPDCTPSGVLQLAGGKGHTCALLVGGHVRCWGRNDLGQLGLAEAQDHSEDPPHTLGPVELEGEAVALSAGADHTCARMADETVQCWGNNASGQLGLGHTSAVGDTEHPGPAVSRVELTRVQQIAAGGNTTCALTDSGEVHCWGENLDGQLGLGNTDPAAVPTPVPLGQVARHLTVSGRHVCAALDNGDILCWGYNAEGELGIGPSPEDWGDLGNWGDESGELASGGAAIDFESPFDVVTSLAAGGRRTCVLFEGPRQRCWGYNGDGGLGANRIGYIGDDPTPATEWGYFIWESAPLEIAVGNGHQCTRLQANELRCWGVNDKGQLGVAHTMVVGDTLGSLADTPPIAFGLDDQGNAVFATHMATGERHTCALLSTGDVKCWGHNQQGQLGLGYASPPPHDYVGGDADSTPDQLPSVAIFAAD